MGNIAMSQPWYMYPWDSPGGGYGEICDPQSGYTNGKCNYLKPDTNIAVPSGTPITALTSGVVTNIQDKPYAGGLSVTVKMDQALNSLAQYVNYNFLGGTSVNVGQRVSVGQQIGTAGSPYGIDFALALSSGPVWGGSGFQYNAQGNPLLDPRQLLNAAKGGTLPTSSVQSGVTGGASTSSQSPSQCAPWDIPCLLSEAVHSDYTQRGGIIFVGVLLALIGVVVLFIGHGAQVNVGVK